MLVAVGVIETEGDAGGLGGGLQVEGLGVLRDDEQRLGGAPLVAILGQGRHAGQVKAQHLRRCPDEPW